MLGIAKMSGAGAGQYYTDLAREDYYLKGGEPPGRWVGGASDQMVNFEKKVSEKTLQNLLSGNDYRGNPLTRNAGKEGRQAGWDMTFSAPKSVSVVWSQADQATRKAIQEVQQEAVEATLRYAEREFGHTRRGKGGEIQEDAELLFATFEHGTSRAQDPNLHTHCLLMNVCRREDGSTGTIDTRELYKNKLTLGAIYRAELAKNLEQHPELGFQVERDRFSFRVKGVSESLEKEFSKRRQAVEEEMKRAGFEGGKAAKVAALNTRESKPRGEISRSELFQEWKEVGESHQFSTEQVEEIKKPEEERRPVIESKFRGWKEGQEAMKNLTDRQSYFTEHQLVGEIAVSGVHNQLGIRGVEREVERLKETPELISLGKIDGKEHFTTKEMLEIEKKMVSQVRYLRGDSQESKFDLGQFEASCKKTGELSSEQKRAVAHLINEKSNIGVVSGMAGTGKSYMLSAARDYWEEKGHSVYGMALSGKAAQGLKEGAGIESITVHRFINHFVDEGRKFPEGTVFVVDEAAMVGTKQMQKITEYSKEQGAKLVLVGDSRQLQAIEAGGAFKRIGKEVGEERLSKIRRQDSEWERLAIHSIADGNATEGLRAYADRGMVTVGDTPEEVSKSLVDDWSKEGIEKPEENLILAGTNSQVRRLNEIAQAKMYKAGKLGQESVRGDGSSLFQGDRVLFTRNSSSFGVKNGSLGTIKEVEKEGRAFTARLDNGEEVTIRPKDYEHFRLGYAVTTHKSQGMTCKHSYILSGGSMLDKELSYVQVSRAKEGTRIYTDRQEAGEELTQLARRMSRSREKELAIDLLSPRQERALLSKEKGQEDVQEKSVQQGKERSQEQEQDYSRGGRSQSDDYGIEM